MTVLDDKFVLIRRLWGLNNGCGLCAELDGRGEHWMGEVSIGWER